MKKLVLLAVAMFVIAAEQSFAICDTDLIGGGPTVKQNANLVTAEVVERMQPVAEALLKGSFQKDDPEDRFVIKKSEWLKIKTDFGFTSDEQTWLALHKGAASFALPPMSQYHVSNFIVDSDGDLVFGINMEFTDPRTTVHGEQFGFIRTLMRGKTPVAVVLDGGACGHCRQVMMEYQHGPQILYIAMAETNTLGEMLKDPFWPGELGGTGIQNLTASRFYVKPTVPTRDYLADLAVAAATRAYSPYMNFPNGTAIRLKNGEIIQGVYVENVNFNGSTPSFETALIELVARGYSFADIKKVVFAEGAYTTGKPSYRDAVRVALARIAPEAILEIQEIESAAIELNL